MARRLPKIGTTLRPYDTYRRYRATVVGYAKHAGVKKVKLRSHGTHRETTATLAHISRTFKPW